MKQCRGGETEMLHHTVGRVSEANTFLAYI